MPIYEVDEIVWANIVEAELLLANETYKKKFPSV